MQLALLRRLSAAFLASFFLSARVSAAAEGSFSDVPSSNPAFAPIEFVKEQGIMNGNDGLFKPKSLVTRAEAVKILVSMRMKPEEIATYSKTLFSDIPENAWYRTYVDAAVEKLGFIQGPQKSPKFDGAANVDEASFLKMLFVALGIDTNAFGEIRLPLGTDVTDVTVWHYAIMRTAVAFSLIQTDSHGALRPGAKLTRADVATLIYRLKMYLAGRREQSLLSAEEADLGNVLTAMQNKDANQAMFAAARALVAARGALAAKPDVPIIQGAVKTAEAFNSIVQAYIAGSSGRLQDVITLSKDAWNAANKATQFSPGLKNLIANVQSIAKTMADQAREMLKQQSSSK